jgi:hypothetical protein
MFCSFSLTATFSFAQTNTLPTTGNIGIGTLSPSATLDVNGNMIVDSSVVVKDSLHVQKKLLVDQDIKIQGKSVFVDNAKFKSNLKVLGIGKFNDKLVVDGLTRMNGDVKVFGDFKIKSLADTSLSAHRLLSILPNGRIGIAPAPPIDPSGCLFAKPWTYLDGTPTDDDIALCPDFKSVTIGGDFIVSGETRLNVVGIGTLPDNNNQLTLQSINKEATVSLFTVISTNPTAPKYAIKNKVNNDELIAYSVTNATNQDVFVVKGSGAVGIATANPQDKLQVGDNYTKLVIGDASGSLTGFGTSYIGFNISRQIAGTDYLWQTEDDGAHDGGAVIYADILGGLRFSTIPTVSNSGQTNIQDGRIKKNTRLYIREDGNIGIGTEKVGGYKLSVDGFIRAREIDVNLSNWSDFVFYDDYVLKTLPELEAYITENKHLPDVPSEKEVLANGVSLGKMDAILLQKVEELTLYIIAMNKRIAQLEKENQSLKK